MPLPQNYKIAGVLSCLYQRDKINAFVLSQVREFRNVFNNNNNREIVFRFVTRTKKQVYYTMRNRVSHICIPRLRSCTETLRWVRPWSGWKLRFLAFLSQFLYRVQIFSSFSFCSWILRRHTWKARPGWRFNQRCRWELEQLSGSIQRCTPIRRLYDRLITFNELIVLLIKS